MEATDLVKSFDNLIRGFETVCPVGPTLPPTYLEVTGKARKEDVISNVLAFFFDPDEPHGLGNIFYRVFMECFGLSEDVSAEQIVAVNREATTATGKRIDLIIETDKRMLAIENKVHHWLNNDLDEYAAHIRRMDRVKICHLAVLSLYPQSIRTNNVPNVCYEPFLDALEAGLIKYGVTATPTYSPFLSDFFQTIRNLKSHDMLDEQLRKYFIDNKETIDRLLDEKRKFDNDINGKAHKLMGILESRPDVTKQIWNGFVVINQKFFPNGLHLKVDCVIDFKGFWIHVFVQKHGKDESTADVLNSIPYFQASTDWNTWVNEEAIPYDTPLEEVAERVNDVLRIVFP